MSRRPGTSLPPAIEHCPEKAHRCSSMTKATFSWYRYQRYAWGSSPFSPVLSGRGGEGGARSCCGEHTLCCQHPFEYVPRRSSLGSHPPNFHARLFHVAGGVSASTRHLKPVRSFSSTDCCSCFFCLLLRTRWRGARRFSASRGACSPLLER